MLVQQMYGLGDLTSSAARRRQTVSPGGTSSAAPSISTSIRTAQARNIANMWQGRLAAAQSATGGFIPGTNLIDYTTTPAQAQARVAAIQAKVSQASENLALKTAGGNRSAAAAVRARFGSPAAGAAPLSPAALTSFLSPIVAAPAAAIPGKAPGPDVAAVTSALTTTTPSMSTGGGGGGGGGGVDTPPDTTDALTDEPTGWAALSPTMKVAVVVGGVVVAYVGYRVVRRR